MKLLRVRETITIIIADQMERKRGLEIIIIIKEQGMIRIQDQQRNKINICRLEITTIITKRKEIKRRLMLLIVKKTSLLWERITPTRTQPTIPPRKQQNKSFKISILLKLPMQRNLRKLKLP